MIIPLSRKHVPLAATAMVLLLLFGTASFLYKGFFSLRVVVNLFSDNAFLAITAIGTSFVILSGGIDLSIGAVIGFTTIFVASMIERHAVHPVVVWTLALMIGTAFGCLMGLLIQVFKLPPFMVTLGGMFFARGMAFVVNMQSVGINHPLYGQVVAFGIPLTERASIPVSALIFFTLFLVALYMAHFTRFGRNVYALGGNEQSAILMGLPAGYTKVMVYTFNGFCSALAGIVLTFYTSSGDPSKGLGMELDAIACVVIGGTLLTGGIGYVAGTLLGVLIFGTIQQILFFDGRLNSWWLRIVIGLLLLLFILLQKLLTTASASSQVQRENA
jgi:simple sugar transport system permease protein